MIPAGGGVPSTKWGVSPRLDQEPGKQRPLWGKGSVSQCGGQRDSLPVDPPCLANADLGCGHSACPLQDSRPSRQRPHWFASLCLGSLPGLLACTSVGEVDTPARVQQWLQHPAQDLAGEVDKAAPFLGGDAGLMTLLPGDVPPQCSHVL